MENSDYTPTIIEVLKVIDLDDQNTIIEVKLVSGEVDEVGMIYECTEPFGKWRFLGVSHMTPQSWMRGFRQIELERIDDGPVLRAGIKLVSTGMVIKPPRLPIQLLLAQLESAYPHERRRAVRELQHFDEPQVVESIIGILKSDHDLRTRCAAAEALGKLGDKRAIDALRVCLDGEDREMLISAIKALGRLQDIAIADRLMTLLEHSDELVVEEAIEALYELAHPPAMAAFRKLFRDPRHGVQWRAIASFWSLGELLGEDSEQEIRLLLSDNSESIRGIAEQILELIKLKREEYDQDTD